MERISNIVGATLGPGGSPILIERYESDMPPLITKDGVTVFKSLGFEDPIEQVVLDSARDAAIKTANIAGDGTTTATILAESFVRQIHEYCAKHPTFSPQGLIRELYDDYESVLEPLLKSLVFRPGSCSFTNTKERAYEVYHGVASVSANGDTALADAVLKCYGLVGDYGNVSIVEASGNASYEVEEMDGYFLGSGYQDLGQFYPAFINDAARQVARLEKPRFVLYFGRINHLNALYRALSDLAEDFDCRNQTGESKYDNHDVVVVATGFSEQVLGTLAAAFQTSSVLNVYPLVIPKMPMQNGQLQFLQDLSAITGAKIFNPLDAPLETCTTQDLGPGVDAFEAHGFKSSVIGFADGCEEAVLRQADSIRAQLISPESQLEQIWLQERLAKITNGIAKLIVRGSSMVEVRERKDRAEDAVCAVKGAIHHGVLPGGAWAMEVLSYSAHQCKNESSRGIFKRAFSEPLNRLLNNAGIIDPVKIEEIRARIHGGFTFNSSVPLVYDALSHKIVNPHDVYLYDSAQAVFESIKNSFSIASVVGTMGGVVAFKRDDELERQAAREYAQDYKEMKEYKE